MNCKKDLKSDQSLDTFLGPQQNLLQHRHARQNVFIVLSLLSQVWLDVPHPWLTSYSIHCLELRGLHPVTSGPNLLDESTHIYLTAV